jgi:hypothetical protein
MKLIRPNKILWMNETDTTNKILWMNEIDTTNKILWMNETDTTNKILWMNEIDASVWLRINDRIIYIIVSLMISSLPLCHSVFVG